MKKDPSRRTFIPVAATAFAVVPRHVLGRSATPSPSDKLNIAAVGIGGMGKNYIAGCKSENIVAMADVDDNLAAPVRAQYPQAKSYRDYREMFDKEKNIDAVIIGTPDHSHAVIAMAAMELGKGVYCAKPMTRTIRECRAVTKAAEQAKVPTQMSVQSCASDEACSTEEWIQAGAVGPVREVHVWTDRPVWPQAITRSTETPAVPPSINWDIWLGPAPRRPYHPIYHPFNFRGWYDFGTGALGDMGCHAFHVIVRALDLGYPTTVSADRTVSRIYAPQEKPEPVWARSVVARHPETFPTASLATWDFPARADKPPVRMTWYDGGLKPPRPPEMALTTSLGSDGILFLGEKGFLLSGFTGGPKLLSPGRQKEFAPPPKTLARSIGHYTEWIQACKGGKMPNCHFGFGSQLTEICLLGVVAQRTGQCLEYDSQAMRFTNHAEANGLLDPPYRAGWSL